MNLIDYTIYSLYNYKWGPVLAEILKYFEEKKYGYSAYTQILIEEKLYDKLLNYCKGKRYFIENFYPYLIDDYFEDVNEIFIEFLEEIAEDSHDRRKYKEVCKHIKTYEKACGREHAQELVNVFKEKYIRRPAFVDELKKLKWAK